MLSPIPPRAGPPDTGPPGNGPPGNGPPDAAPSDVWHVTDTAPPLVDGAVHLWRFALDRPVDELARLSTLLSDDESTRASRFGFPGLRERFIGGRGLLRTILGRYLHAPPERICFAYNNFGKPALAGELAESGLTFNLSHSGELALLGVAHGREIGVDIERHRANVNCEQLAEHFFSPAEVAALADLSPGERRAGFFACWSRKEAYIKAVGRGLSTPLDGFAVTLAPGAPAELLSVRDAPGEVGRWMLASLAAGEDYSAAVCAERPVRETRLFQWI